MEVKNLTTEKPRSEMGTDQNILTHHISRVPGNSIRKGNTTFITNICQKSVFVSVTP